MLYALHHRTDDVQVFCAASAATMWKDGCAGVLCCMCCSDVKSECAGVLCCL